MVKEMKMCLKKRELEKEKGFIFKIQILYEALLSPVLVLFFAHLFISLIKPLAHRRVGLESRNQAKPQ